MVQKQLSLVAEATKLSKKRLGKHHVSPSQKNNLNLSEKTFFNHTAPLTRTKAFLVDTFMITMPIAYFVIYVVMSGGKGFEANKELGWLIILLLHAPVIISLWFFKSQTPGMKGYEIAIASLTDEQTKPSFINLALRYAIMPLSIISVVGVLMAKFRKDKLTLHDLISKTKIINTTK